MPSGAASRRSNASDEISLELERLLGGRSDVTLEEMQRYLDRIVQRRNDRPLDDFQGLSPEQMYRILNFPYASPDLVSFNMDLPPDTQAPVLTVFEVLADVMGGRGIKPTGTGALPRAPLRRIQDAADVAQLLNFIPEYPVRSEHEALVIQAIRLTAKEAGLWRTYGGRFVLTRRCRDLLDRSGTAGVYEPLFRAWTQRFNWNYPLLDEGPYIVQQSFLFTLRNLQRYGKPWRPCTYYEELFMRAFPVAIEETTARPYGSSAEVLSEAYSYGALRNFAGIFGLVEIEYRDDWPRPYSFRIRKTPLLDRVVTFAV